MDFVAERREELPANQLAAVFRINDEKVMENSSARLRFDPLEPAKKRRSRLIIPESYQPRSGICPLRIGFVTL